MKKSRSVIRAKLKSIRKKAYIDSIKEQHIRLDEAVCITNKKNRSFG